MPTLRPNQITRLSETKHKLVDASVKLMRARGYNATTVDDICGEAGVTKGGFFHYFKSKDDIARTALTYFHEGKVSDYEAAPFRKFTDPLDRVFGRLDYVEESVGTKGRVTKGCLIGMFAQELAFTNPEIRDVCQNFFSRIVRDFSNDLAEAKAAHKSQRDFDTDSLAQLYLAIVQGTLMLAKIAGNNDVIHNNIEQFRSFLKCLFGVGPTKSADVSKN